MPFADSGGVRIHYEECGEGQTLVFVHEFAGDIRSWEPQLRYFSRLYHCIAFNARGYPPSDVPEAPDAYSLDHAVEDLVNVLGHLGVDRAHVVGLSMGSFTTLNFGLRHPERALSLVVAGGGYGALSDDRGQFQEEVDSLAKRFESEGSATVADYMGNIPTRLPLKRKDPRGWAHSNAILADHPPLGAALTLRGVQATRPSFHDVDEALRGLTIPLLLVAGDEDDPSLEPMLHLKRVVPAAALCVLPKTGHAVNLEEPDRFNEVVQDFLATVTAGRFEVREDPARSGKVI